MTKKKLILLLIQEPTREPTPPQEYRKSGLPRRKTKLPKRFQDILPPRPPVLAAPTPIIDTPQPSQHESEVPPDTDFKTGPNTFGIFRIFKGGEPSFTPDDSFRITNVSDGPNFIQDPPQARSAWASPFGIGTTPVHEPSNSDSAPTYFPFKNMSIFRLMQWFYDSSLTKSLGTLNDLVYKVLLAPDFDTKDLTGFDAAREARRLDDDSHDKNDSVPANPIKDAWIETTVPISVPCDNVSYPSEADAPVFHVKGLMYRKPLEIIRPRTRTPQLNKFTFPPTRNTGNQDPTPLPNEFTLNCTTLMPSLWNTRHILQSLLSIKKGKTDVDFALSKRKNRRRPP